MTNKKYKTPDGEMFERKLPARQHVVDRNEDVNHTMAKQMLDEYYPNGEKEEDTLEVFTFRYVEYLAAEKSVKVKATCEDEAEERAEEFILGQSPKVTHTVHTEMHKLSKVDEVPRKKIESGEYYEEDN